MSSVLPGLEVENSSLPEAPAPALANIAANSNAPFTIHIKRDVLAAELLFLSGVVGKAKNLPILECIKLEALAGHRLALTASNMEITLRTEVQADAITGAGSLLLRYAQLSPIIKLLPNEIVQISLDASKQGSFTDTEQLGWAIIKTSASRLKVPVLSEDNYPPLPATPAPATFAIDTQILQSLINGVDYALAPESDARYLLQAAQFAFSKGVASMVATDGYRMCVAKYGTPSEEATVQLQLLLTKSCLAELTRALPLYEGTVEMASNENYDGFYFGNRSMTSLKPIGAFPDYEKVINKAASLDQRISLADASLLVSALRRTILMADTSNKAVLFKVKNSQLKIATRSASMGAAFEVLPVAEDNNVQEALVAMNAKFMLEFLTNIGGSAVRIGFKDGASPMLFVAANNDVTYSCMLTPMRSDIIGDFPEDEA